MRMQALRSAAHAAGYAMATEEATEETAEAPVVSVCKEPSRALTLHKPRRARSRILLAQIYVRRLTMRGWYVPHWSGRAAA
jgi:hypothetical protein